MTQTQGVIMQFNQDLIVNGIFLSFQSKDLAHYYGYEIQRLGIIQFGKKAIACQNNEAMLHDYQN